MSKTEAEKELKITKESFKDFVQRYEKNPQKAHKDLDQCEIVDPDEHVDEEVSTFSTAATSQPWKSTELHNRHPGIRFDCHLD